jgi:glycosyltransferase involved in cell wall biosynthesis
MGKPIVATDADGLQDVLSEGVDARIVGKRNAAALAESIVALAGNPQERERLGARARITGAQYDIDLFVRKMERLYPLLHASSRATNRRGIMREDLSFLTGGTA